MSKRLTIYITTTLLALISLLVIGFNIYLADGFKLSEAQVQTLIKERLPFERDPITVEDVTVALTSTEVAMTAKISGRHPHLGQDFSLIAYTVGQPSYRAGKVYFVPSDIRFEQVVFVDQGRSISDRLRGAAERYLSNHEGVRNVVRELAPNVELWLKTQSLRLVTTVLSQVPVYTLPDDSKGLAAKVLLERVYIENNELVVTFTLWRLTWFVIGGALSFILAIGCMIVLVRHPSAFLGAVALGSWDQ